MHEWSAGSLGLSGIIQLADKQGQTITSLSYSNTSPWPALPAVANLSIELSDLNLNGASGSNWRYSFEDGGTPGKANERQRFQGIYINELVSKYGSLVADEFGNHTDWIELYNSYDQPVYLGGLALFDSETACQECVFSHTNPDALRIGAKSYILLFADDRPDLGQRHLPFQLQSSGESLTLARSDHGFCTAFDQVSFGPLGEDQAWGRYPDGSPDWMIMSVPTPGASNKSMNVDDFNGLVINEIVSRYDQSYPDEHGLFSDWFELFNGSQQVMNLAGLFLTDNSADPMKYQIPISAGDSALIQPGGFKVFRADALPKLGYNHADFQLASSGESLAISIVSGAIRTLG